MHAAAGSSDKERDRAARVRENQRAFRARKRELVDSLRAQLAELQRRGVQATLEMQQAARTVTAENRKLRELLAQRGVTHAEVEAFLHPQSPSPNQSPPSQLMPHDDSPEFRSVLETSCDDAAAILAQIRGHDSAGAMRDSLGCMGQESCMVSNTKLLQLMDEAT